VKLARRIKAAYRAFTAPWRQSAQRGGYEGAKITNYVNFATRLEAAHNERKRDLGALRAHSRDLHKNSSHMKAYADLVVTNVIGPDGVDFENNLIDMQGKAQDEINDIVEAARKDWAQCVTADGQMSWFDFEQLVARSLAVDGEAFVHLLRGHGPHGLLLELIDPDRIDHNLNTALNNGR
jgi:capsid protein